jgi:membrane protein YdbS with pleckstrin-like domain
VGLRPPAHRVSARAIGYWTVRAAIGWLVLIALQVSWLIGVEVVWLIGSGSGHRSIRITVLTITVVLAVLHLAVMPQWRYRIHRWENTDEAVYTQTGWFTQERRIAPISRIQTVDSQSGLLERAFKLANVTVTTASAAGPLKIHGLAQEDAQQLVAHLSTRTAATPGDAT